MTKKLRSVCFITGDENNIKAEKVAAHCSEKSITSVNRGDQTRSEKRLHELSLINNILLSGKWQNINNQNKSQHIKCGTYCMFILRDTKVITK